MKTKEMFHNSLIDKNWTLFLDRDGVINEEIVGEYVLNWDGFNFAHGALDALTIFANKFGRIVIVSNQRGVTKGLMTEADLLNIHDQMLQETAKVGGRIDKIYYCTDIDDSSYNRKPNPGMAFKAQKDFPEINFVQSVMVGNKPSDMKFGRRAGMHTVFITSTNPDQIFPHADIDAIYPSLYAFAEDLES